MNKVSIIDFLGFILVKFLSIVCCYLPLRPALWIGRRMGDLACIVNYKRRAIAYVNIKAAFPEKKTGEIKRILKAHYESLGMSVVELLKLPILKKRYLDKYIELRDFDRIERSLKKGKGVVLLAAHFGNWEIASLAANSRGHSINVFARDQKYPRLNNLLNKYREMSGCRIVAKGFAVREIIKALRNNEIVGMLADQDAGANGVFVNFMHRPASTAQGPVNFALKTGADIVTCFIRRLDFNRHVIDMGGPIEPVNTGEKEKDIRKNLDKITDITESYIRKYPDQWLWSHKRWKSTPQRTILVLSDGKAGHLNQALAIAEMVSDALGSRLKARGIEEKPIVKINVVELKFKNKFTRMFLDMASFFSGRRCQGCLKCMKFCLEREAFDGIKKQYADMIISCGAPLSGANAFLKYENNAKGVVIMKPGLGRSKKFDLIILPRHDAPKRSRSNILVTEVAPNRIKPRAHAPYPCGTGSGLEPGAKGIGLLIGGDAKNFKLTKETVEKVVGGVLKIAEETGRDIFITTSRRTSPEIDSFLKDKLGRHGRCKLLVIANEDNPEGAVQKILDMSEVVIVSPESVSMISEAVSSGRHVAVFKEHKNTRAQEHKNKYEKNIKNLEERGYIRTAVSDEIYATIRQILIERPAVRKLNDRERIAKRLEGII